MPVGVLMGHRSPTVFVSLRLSPAEARALDAYRQQIADQIQMGLPSRNATVRALLRDGLRLHGYDVLEWLVEEPEGDSLTD